MGAELTTTYDLCATPVKKNEEVKYVTTPGPRDGMQCGIQNSYVTARGRVTALPDPEPDACET